jgi:preprotein translocase subunit SecD
VSPRTRPQAGRQRWLVISILFVVVVAFGSLAATLVAGWSPRLGLDLAGGLSVVYQPAHPVSQSDLNETVDILTNRVDALGVSGAEVSTQGNDIVVSVPGVTNARAVLAQIGQTAQLLFRPVECYAPKFVGASSSSAQPAGTTLPACGSQYQLSAANLNVQPDTSTAAGFTANPIGAAPALADYRTTTPENDDATKTVLLPGLPGDTQRYLAGPSQLTGHAVKSAQATQNQLGQWEVDYTLTSTGSAQWDQVAEANFHQVVAIELDGVVQSAPIIQPTQSSFSSFQGQGTISGSMTQASAQNLAVAMNFGALPVRLDPLTTETISPTLGKASLQAGLAAGIAGLLLVLLYTIIYYRALGLVIVSGLAVTAALLWSIICGLGHTSIAPSFTLAGVTGLIVSIGITVDSYIVYFERLKDETRAGRTVRTSVDRGFKSAWRTVLAADLVSLIAAAVLYWIAIGDVRGFAFFLGLSTLLDIFVTWFYTRPLVIVLGRNDRVTAARGFGISRGLAIRQPEVREPEVVG